MMGGNMPSLADIAAVTRNGDGGFGNGEGWWVLIILFALFGGWGNNGRNNGNGGESYDAAVQRGFDNQAVISKLDGLNNGVCSLGYDQLNQMNGINTNILTQANALSRQFADCCCDQRVGQMQIMNQMGSDACAITTAINQAAQNIMQNDNNNYRQLHDENIQLLLAQKDEKIAELRGLAERQDLRASQIQQTSDIVSQVLAQLRQCPVGTYNVANPNCCNNQDALSLLATLIGNGINPNQLFNRACGCGNC